MMPNSLDFAYVALVLLDCHALFCRWQRPGLTWQQSSSRPWMPTPALNRSASLWQVGYSSDSAWNLMVVEGETALLHDGAVHCHRAACDACLAACFHQAAWKFAIFSCKATSAAPGVVKLRLLHIVDLHLYALHEALTRVCAPFS